MGLYLGISYIHTGFGSAMTTSRKIDRQSKLSRRHLAFLHIIIEGTNYWRRVFRKGVIIDEQTRHTPFPS